MINHVRTLLVNRRVSDLSGDRYVDPGFVPIPLTGVRSAIRSSLFPGEPSVDELERRMRIYDPFLFLPDFQKYLKWLDPRVSYEPPNSLEDGYSSTVEFHTLFSNLAAVISVDLRGTFPSDGTLAEPIGDMQRVWVGATRDHEKFAAVLFAQAFAIEETRSV